MYYRHIDKLPKRFVSYVTLDDYPCPTKQRNAFVSSFVSLFDALQFSSTAASCHLMF